MKANVTINLDNEHDMIIVDNLLKTSESKSLIGLRINPVVGAGNIGTTSTATRESKFGLPVTPQTRDKVIRLFEKYIWLRGVHTHVGSQGVGMDRLVEAVKVQKKKKKKTVKNVQSPK